MSHTNNLNAKKPTQPKNKGSLISRLANIFQHSHSSKDEEQNLDRRAQSVGDLLSDDDKDTKKVGKISTGKKAKDEPDPHAVSRKVTEGGSFDKAKKQEKPSKFDSSRKEKILLKSEDHASSSSLSKNLRGARSLNDLHVSPPNRQPPPIPAVGSHPPAVAPPQPPLPPVNIDETKKDLTPKNRPDHLEPPTENSSAPNPPVKNNPINIQTELARKLNQRRVLEEAAHPEPSEGPPDKKVAKEPETRQPAPQPEKTVAKLTAAFQQPPAAVAKLPSSTPIRPSAPSPKVALLQEKMAIQLPMPPGAGRASITQPAVDLPNSTLNEAPSSPPPSIVETEARRPSLDTGPEMSTAVDLDSPLVPRDAIPGIHDIAKSRISVAPPSRRGPRRGKETSRPKTAVIGLPEIEEAGLLLDALTGGEVAVVNVPPEGETTQSSSVIKAKHTSLPPVMTSEDVVSQELESIVSSISHEDTAIRPATKSGSLRPSAQNPAAVATRSSPVTVHPAHEPVGANSNHPTVTNKGPLPTVASRPVSTRPPPPPLATSKPLTNHNSPANSKPPIMKSIGENHNQVRTATTLHPSPSRTNPDEVPSVHRNPRPLLSRRRKMEDLI